MNRSTLKIVAASVIIIAVIAWLAVSGVQANKSYYVTIPELNSMGDKSYTRNLRVEGFVKPSSIERDGTNATFVLAEFESHSANATPDQRTVLVKYVGAEPPPDTFKDNAQALAVGRYGRDGVFHATELQAKCASKYTAAPGTTTTPATPAAYSAPSPNKS
jgi:cytochrome c-type biogenesis protein CcmE